MVLAVGAAAATAVDVPPPASQPAPGAAPPPPAGGTTGATPAQTSAVPEVRLAVGSRGPVVRDLQRELRRRGARIRVDGVFGDSTRVAVIRQQRRLRLPATGVADAALLTRLGLQSLRVAAAPTALLMPLSVRVDRWPVTGRFESPFGPRWGRPHEGIDISNEPDTPIHAALTGVVAQAGQVEGYADYGNQVVIDHGNGLRTRYAHMSQVLVVVGQPVTTGDVVGLMGDTGSATGVHLHFEVLTGDVAIDPLLALPPRPAAVVMPPG